jgi:hypothetical protein
MPAPDPRRAARYTPLAEALAGRRFAPMGAGARQAASFTPMAGLASTLSSPAQASQAAAYSGPSLGQIDANRALAVHLIGNAQQGPTGGWVGALAKALTAGVGGYTMGRANRQEAEAYKGLNTALDAAGGDVNKISGVLGQIDPKMRANFLMQQALNPQEAWSPYTDATGRTGQRSSLSGKVDWDPNKPAWQDEGYRRFMTEQDERDFRQAQELEGIRHGNRLGEIRAVPREGPIGFNPPVNDPNLGWGQFDSRGQWHDADGTEGQLTAPQQAANAEIDAAREQLDALDLGRDDLLARTKSADDLGMESPDFDPRLRTLIAKASQHKTGEDPDFMTWHERLFGEDPVPPPEGGPTGGSGGEPPPQSTAAQSAMPLPTDRSNLQVGNVYRTSQGPGIYLGGGRFELVE